MDIFVKLPLEMQQYIYDLYLPMWFEHNSSLLMQKHYKHFRYVLNDIYEAGDPGLWLEDALNITPSAIRRDNYLIEKGKLEFKRMFRREIRCELYRKKIASRTHKKRMLLH